jgi:hypothetical protein
VSSGTMMMIWMIMLTMMMLMIMMCYIETILFTATWLFIGGLAVISLI